MKRKVIKIAIVCMSLMIASAGGYLASRIWLKNNTNDQEFIPSHALYPYLTFQDMVTQMYVYPDRYIVDATVSSVGEAYTQYEPFECTITPAQLDVHTSFMNHTSIESVTFLQQGGTGPNMREPEGLTMYEGMDVVLFMTSLRYVLHPAAIFPVSNGNVVLNSEVLEHFDPSEVTTMSTDELEPDIRKQISLDTVYVMPKEAFIAEIIAILEEASPSSE
jgi:hypothetical protein